MYACQDLEVDPLELTQDLVYFQEQAKTQD